MKPDRLQVITAKLDAAIALEASIEPIRALCVADLAKYQFKAREPILEPVLNTQDLLMVFAPRGIGKTHFCFAMSFAIATGGKFAKWQAVQPRKVVYLDGELPGGVMQKRIAMHCPSVAPDQDYLRVFTPDLLPDGVPLPDLATSEGQAVINDVIGDAEVVVLDNLSAWARQGKENDAESWLPVSDWMLRLRRQGKSVVLVHHAGKGGQQRGTSKREDLLDAVIGLSRPSDYETHQGAVFVMEFTKSRHMTGQDAEPIELALQDVDGKAVWTWRTVEASTYDRVVALSKEGLSQTEIAIELDINKSTVSRALRKAREAGHLPKAEKL